MKVFVCEYCCCQPAQAEEKTQALRAEGLAMLCAIMTDLGRIPGVDAVSLLANDLPGASFPCRRINPEAEQRAFRRLASAADWTLVIAPESDGLLEERCRWVQEAGGRLLGTEHEAIRMTADKYELAHYLIQCKVPTLTTRLLEEGVERFPAVLKPRDGAGSLSTYLVRDQQKVDQIRREEPHVEFISQPYWSGTAASVSILIGPGLWIPMMPAGQRVPVQEGRLSYRGGWAPLGESLRARARRLARNAVRSVPGLRGHVGVDLILGADPTGAADVVVEINPRLTTSYIGLRRLARSNLAAALLGVMTGRRPRLRWRPGITIRW
jgi:predicted ATP-grasp superfamily ATP-dependent carboligase